MTETYVRVGRKNSNKNVYHTDRDCKRLKSDVRVVAESEVEYQELTLCQWCDPDIENPNAQYDQDHSYQKRLKRAAKKE